MNDIAASIADRLRCAEPADHPNRRDYKPDPLRPDPITLQAHDDLHDHDHGSGLPLVEHSVEDAFDPLTGPFGRAMTGEDVFNKEFVHPWDRRGDYEILHQAKTDQRHLPPSVRVDDQLLAQEALARMEAHLPPGATDRKGIPVATGFIDYFPDAVAAVAQLSRIGNDQHNPGTPLHWDRAKSGDESDCLMRHFLERGTFDNDGVRHSVKVAWRAMALLQKEIEAAKERLEPVFR